MGNNFYDFFKIDKNFKYKHGDFSAANGECLTPEERVEFLKAYSDFLDEKNGAGMPEKAVSDEETKKLTAALSYKIVYKIRKRAVFDEMTAKIYEKPENFSGWQFYQNVSEESGELVFSDGIIPPVPCAKYEFNCEKMTSFAFSFVLPEEYIDEEKRREKVIPLTTDTGRIIELRRGVTEILKLQIYRNGEIYARVGLPDPYHHKNFKLGDFNVNERNGVIIDLYGDFYEVKLNGNPAGKFELTNKATPDTLFISGGMHPVCKWSFKPESLTADGKTITNFFTTAEPKEEKKQNLGNVKLPFKIGGAKNKDKIVELTKKFTYDGRRAILNIGSLDPCGEVYVNGNFAFKTDGFLKSETDITEFLKEGENELKVLVFPRAPEINYSWHKNEDPYIAWLARGIYIDFLPESHIRDLVVKTVGISEKMVKAEISFKTVNFKRGLKTKIYLAKSPCEAKFVRCKSERTKSEKTVCCGEEVIFDGDGTENFEAETEFGADLWACEKPVLYTVRAELIDDGKPVDDEITETGFRTIEQKNGDILLNGKKILLNGALWMQFLPPYENIVLSHICPTLEEIVWQAAMTRALNGNVARFHMLGYGNNDPRYAEVCDRLGLMNIWTTRLIDSAETIDVKNGWRAGKIYAEQMKEVINHPSIITWEGSNEFHSSRAVLDKMYDEFVKTVQATDDTRLICPCSHLYYGGGLYGNKGFYYQDDGKFNQDFEPCESSFGWKSEKVVRSSHNYEILLGYGGKWDVFREQGWKSQPALFESKDHAYIISEFAVIGRQDNRTREAESYHKDDSYELADEKRAFGEAYDKLNFRLSQAYQAFCAYNVVKYMRYLAADGLTWCCLTGGANDGSYIKPPIDFYGYKKQAFYALKEGFAETICFDKKVGAVYNGGYVCEPAITGAEKGKTYSVGIVIKNQSGEVVCKKKIVVKATAFTFDLEPFEVNLEDGYYSVEYRVEA